MAEEQARVDAQRALGHADGSLTQPSPPVGWHAIVRATTLPSVRGIALQPSLPSARAEPRSSAGCGSPSRPASAPEPDDGGTRRGCGALHLMLCDNGDASPLPAPATPQHAPAALAASASLELGSSLPAEPTEFALEPSLAAPAQEAPAALAPPGCASPRRTPRTAASAAEPHAEAFAAARVVALLVAELLDTLIAAAVCLAPVAIAASLELELGASWPAESPPRLVDPPVPHAPLAAAACVPPPAPCNAAAEARAAEALAAEALAAERIVAQLVGELLDAALAATAAAHLASAATALAVAPAESGERRSAGGAPSPAPASAPRAEPEAAASPSLARCASVGTDRAGSLPSAPGTSLPHLLLPCAIGARALDSQAADDGGTDDGVAARARPLAAAEAVRRGGLYRESPLHGGGTLEGRSLGSKSQGSPTPSPRAAAAPPGCAPRADGSQRTPPPPLAARAPLDSPAGAERAGASPATRAVGPADGSGGGGRGWSDETLRPSKDVRISDGKPEPPSPLIRADGETQAAQAAATPPPAASPPPLSALPFAYRAEMRQLTQERLLQEQLSPHALASQAYRAPPPSSAEPPATRPRARGQPSAAGALNESVLDGAPAAEAEGARSERGTPGTPRPPAAASRPRSPSAAAAAEQALARAAAAAPAEALAAQVGHIDGAEACRAADGSAPHAPAPAAPGCARAAERGACACASDSEAWSDQWAVRKDAHAPQHALAAQASQERSQPSPPPPPPALAAEPQRDASALSLAEGEPAAAPEAAPLPAQRTRAEPAAPAPAQPAAPRSPPCPAARPVRALAVAPRASRAAEPPLVLCPSSAQPSPLPSPLPTEVAASLAAAAAAAGRALPLAALDAEAAGQPPSVPPASAPPASPADQGKLGGEGGSQPQRGSAARAGAACERDAPASEAAGSTEPADSSRPSSQLDADFAPGGGHARAAREPSPTSSIDLNGDDDDDDDAETERGAFPPRAAPLASAPSDGVGESPELSVGAADDDGDHDEGGDGDGREDDGGDAREAEARRARPRVSARGPSLLVAATSIPTQTPTALPTPFAIAQTPTPRDEARGDAAAAPRPASQPRDPRGSQSLPPIDPTQLATPTPPQPSAEPPRRVAASAAESEDESLEELSQGLPADHSSRSQGLPPPRRRRQAHTWPGANPWPQPLPASARARAHVASAAEAEAEEEAEVATAADEAPSASHSPVTALNADLDAPPPAASGAALALGGVQAEPACDLDDDAYNCDDDLLGASLALCGGGTEEFHQKHDGQQARPAPRSRDARAAQAGDAPLAAPPLLRALVDEQLAAARAAGLPCSGLAVEVAPRAAACTPHFTQQATQLLPSRSPSPPRDDRDDADADAEPLLAPREGEAWRTASGGGPAPPRAGQRLPPHAARIARAPLAAEERGRERAAAEPPRPARPPPPPQPPPPRQPQAPRMQPPHRLPPPAPQPLPPPPARVSAAPVAPARAAPSASAGRLGCTKCRWAAAGCAKCRATAGPPPPPPQGHRAAGHKRARATGSEAELPPEQPEAAAASPARPSPQRGVLILRTYARQPPAQQPAHTRQPTDGAMPPPPGAPSPEGRSAQQRLARKRPAVVVSDDDAEVEAEDEFAFRVAKEAHDGARTPQTPRVAPPARARRRLAAESESADAASPPAPPAPAARAPPPPPPPPSRAPVAALARAGALPLSGVCVLLSKLPAHAQPGRRVRERVHALGGVVVEMDELSGAFFLPTLSDAHQRRRAERLPRARAAALDACAAAAGGARGASGASVAVGLGAFVLVAAACDATPLRTAKLWWALAAGRPILSTDWLDACDARAGAAPAAPFLLRPPPVGSLEPAQLQLAAGGGSGGVGRLAGFPLLARYGGGARVAHAARARGGAPWPSWLAAEAIARAATGELAAVDVHLAEPSAASPVLRAAGAPARGATSAGAPAAGAAAAARVRRLVVTQSDDDARAAERDEDVRSFEWLKRCLASQVVHPPHRA